MAVDLDGGIHGRDLRDRAGEAGEDGFQRRPVHSDEMGLQRFPGRILGVGDQPQPQTGNILLFAVFRELYGTGSLSHKHRQNAGGHRIQRAAMAYPLFFQDPPDLGADIHAGPAGEFIDYYNAAGHRRFLIS